MTDNKTCGNDGKAKLLLAYIGIPIIISAFLILHVRQLSAYMSLLYVLMIGFGYVIAVVDFKSKKIPNKLLLLMLSAWIIVIFSMLIFNTDSAIALIVDSALGLLIGGGVFMLVYVASKKSLGGGDVKFMALSGLFIGFSEIIPAMLYGTILAALTGITLMLFKKLGRKDTIPLAPFLYIGILLTIFLR